MEISLQILNDTGLHARPAALFVKEASKYKSDIKVTANDKTVNAKSILKVLSLGLAKGTDIVLSAEGEDAAEALNGLQTLIESKFGEA